MELDKMYPENLVDKHKEAYLVTKDNGGDSTDQSWAVHAATINRFVRTEMSKDPSWRWIGNCILDIWGSYRQLLDISSGRRLFQKVRFKSETRLLNEKLREFERQVAIWRRRVNGE